MFGDAAAYHQFMGRWSSLLAPLLVDFANPGDAGLVLDVGSGTGALAFAIAQRRPRCQVLGIDPSKEYVSYATSKAPQNVKFEVGDAQKLKQPDATFANSLSLLVFNFIPDRAQALREVKRVTKPGGTVSAAVWDYAAGMGMLRTFWDAAVAVDPAAKKFDEAQMPLCRSGELAAFWKQGGLQKVEERTLDIQMQFGSFADYWEPFLLGQGPAGTYVRNADETRRQLLREQLQARLGTRPFALTARAWAVRGAV